MIANGIHNFGCLFVKEKFKIKFLLPSMISLINCELLQGTLFTELVAALKNVQKPPVILKMPRI
jgi:hypothetical protein